MLPIPSGADTTGLTGDWYWTTTTTPSTGTNQCPKTFDAGCRYVVGMALTSVAGSAVVIGRKKGVLIKLKKEKGPLGLSFFALNYSSRCRGRDYIKKNRRPAE